MTISVLQDILTDILEEEPIPKDKVEYLVARAKLRLHDLILRRLAAAEDAPQKLDQATIARRLGVSRAQVSQQLGVPGNWTVASATKLAAAIGGEIDFQWKPFQTPPSERSQSLHVLSADKIAKLRPDEEDSRP
jgi:plasmid maintenance system antidote protein VapI